MTLTTRLAIAMSLLVAVAVSAVGWRSYRSLEQVLLPRVLDRIETHSRLVAAELESYVSGVRGDISIFRSTPALNGLIRAHQAGGIDPVDGVAEKTWQGRIGAFFSSELEARPAYSELRIIGIDDGHREIVRVDRFGPGGAIRIVAGPELKPKGDRGYFRETISLPPGEIYVSPLNLYRRDGVIATPHIPTLRVAAPIYSPDGKPFGIVIADVDMRPALDRARASVRQSGDIYVVNARGDYLVHPDPAREFGSQLGTPTSWQRDFPALASSLGASESAAQIVTDQAGHPGGAALAPAILAASEWVAVIETVPNVVFTAPAAAIRQTAMLVGLIAVLCAAALAVLVARSLTGPIRRLTAAVEGAGGNIPIAVPVDARSETGVLTRAFARVMSEANAKTTALEREVLEHRRTEAARDHYAARERIFSAAVESSSDAIVTQSLDGTVSGWNPAAERLYGYSAAEAVGREIEIVVPPDRSDESRTILRRIGGGETIEPFETVRRCKDGSAVEVLLSVSPIKAPSGTIIGVSKTARDITDSRRTQRALSQQIEERRRIFESSQDLILVTDPGGVLVQVSPSSQTILGYAPEEMIGHNAVEFILGEDLDNAREEMRAARRGQGTRNFDSRYLHKDGRIVTLSWMEAWSEPVKRHFFIGRDMTESRQAQ
ncbi:MAG: PAS domain S-box protein, partial [Bradyrhizobium sp.]